MSRLVGPHEVAALLGVKVATVHMWRSRGVMPEPDYVLSRVPIWRESVIRKWAKETGRE